MKLEILIILILSIMYIIAVVCRAKTDAIVQEFERITKRRITPDFNKYQSLTYVSLTLGSIAIGILFMLLI